MRTFPLALLSLLTGCATEVTVGEPPVELPDEPAVAAPDPSPDEPPGPDVAAVGDEFPVDEPLPLPGVVNEPAVACASTTCLAAWHDGRGVHAARYRAGAVLDLHPIRVAAATRAPTRDGQGPFVWADPTGGFDVRWAGPEVRDGVVLGETQLYSVHVSEDGAPTTPSVVVPLHRAVEPDAPITVGRAGGRAWIAGAGAGGVPRFAWLVAAGVGGSIDGEGSADRTRCVVVGERPLFGSTDGSSLRLRRPADGDAPADVFELPIGPPGPTARPFALTARGAVVTAVWVERGAEAGVAEVRALRFDVGTWSPLDAGPLVVERGAAASLANQDLRVAAGARGTAVVLQGASAPEAPFARLLPASRSTVLGEIPRPRYEGSPIRPAVTGLTAAPTGGDADFVALLAGGFPRVVTRVYPLRVDAPTPVEDDDPSFLGGDVNAQHAPRVACGSRRCALTWDDARPEAPGPRGILVDRETTVPVTTDSVALVGSAVASRGEGFLTCGAGPDDGAPADGLVCRAWDEDGSSGESHVVPLGFRPARVHLAATARGYAVVVREVYDRSLWTLAVDADGRALGSPTELQPPLAGCVASTGAPTGGALLVYRRRQAPGGPVIPVTVRIGEDGSVGAPRAAPALDLATRQGCALLGHAGGITLYGAVPISDGDGRRRTELASWELDAGGDVIAERRVIDEVDAEVSALRATDDALGSALLYAHRPDEGARWEVTLRRVASDHAVVVARDLTVPTPVVAAVGAGVFLTSYGRGGRDIGGVLAFDEPAERVMGRFVELPGRLE
ncbi:MAG TPA: hypothetical protein RMH99_27850 [Sandaracinaceae bacterium LLY-WYZ-13_1]|nr:hypothetical protein [Sandaracinaceae bacterium LLY-WYZ-13_1]